MTTLSIITSKICLSTPIGQQANTSPKRPLTDGVINDKGLLPLIKLSFALGLVSHRGDLSNLLSPANDLATDIDLLMAGNLKTIGNRS